MTAPVSAVGAQHAARFLGSAAAQTAATPASTPAWLDPELVQRRLQQGRTAEYTSGASQPGLKPSTPPSYFRTYEQLKSAMQELAAKHPNLVELVDIGDSSEKVAGTANRDILALRLTSTSAADGGNSVAVADRPRVMYIGGEHAREIANPELLMRWVDQLVKGYGTDPEATALLDGRVITVVPMMNPDGHAVIEGGYAGTAGGNLMQRKNTAAPSGTDLNRNYDYKWGGPGASSNPRSDTYRGAAAASEPEVQAIQNYVLKEKPSVFIDWHSYSRLNLFPWGYTKDPAPHAAGLEAIARRFSTFNHYTPQQSIKLYPTNGTSKDWVYGTLGSAAFTVETGDTFHQGDKEFAESWAANSPVMTYAAKIADAPYDRAKAPDTLDVHVTGTPGGSVREVAAQVALPEAGVLGTLAPGRAIAGAEWFTDPLTKPGSGTPMAAADGAFDGANELVSAQVSDLPRDQMVFVRARDDAGMWGPATAQWAAGNSLIGGLAARLARNSLRH